MQIAVTLNYAENDSKRNLHMYIVQIQWLSNTFHQCCLEVEPVGKKGSLHFHFPFFHSAIHHLGLTLQRSLCEVHMSWMTRHEWWQVWVNSLWTRWKWSCAFWKKDNYLCLLASETVIYEICLRNYHCPIGSLENPSTLSFSFLFTHLLKEYSLSADNVLAQF